MKRFIWSAAAAVLVLMASTTVGAITFDLVGVSDANNTATVNFSYNAGTSTVSIALQNTSVLFNPIITGFSFNAPEAVEDVASFTSSLAGWTYQYEPDSINTPGDYGLFDVAGITGPNLSGGKTNEGIDKGATGYFTFGLTGSGLDALSEESFLGLFSAVGSSGNSTTEYFLARLQGTEGDGEGSDVAVPTTEVPEPGTLLLLGSGLLGVGLLRRRRNS